MSTLCFRMHYVDSASLVRAGRKGLISTQTVKNSVRRNDAQPDTRTRAHRLTHLCSQATGLSSLTARSRALLFLRTSSTTATAAASSSRAAPSTASATCSAGGAEPPARGVEEKRSGALCARRRTLSRVSFRSERRPNVGLST